VNTFLTMLQTSGPLFLIVAAGYLVMKVFRLPLRVAEVTTKIVFAVALPALLFLLMTGLRDLPQPDFRILGAFFGACLLVFVLGRLVGRWLRLDGASRSVFGVGGVFSNNAMLGLPLAKLMLGPGEVPTVALVLVFNSLILWTLVTVAVEAARHTGKSWTSALKTAGRVAFNPIIAAIFAGVVWSFSGWSLPPVVRVPLGWIGAAAGPLALAALGMGLAEFGMGKDRRVTAVLVSLKLLVHPLAVWALAAWWGLSRLETQTLVLLSSIAIGSNVYLMARRFGVLEGPVAQGLLVSTVFSSVTTPLFVALVP
jgi:predicted permease